VEQQLPEAGREVNGGEDSAPGLANVTDAPHVLHGIFICMGMSIQGLKVLHQLDAPIVLGYGKNGAIEWTAGLVNDAEYQPLGYMFLYLASVSIQDLELLRIDWFFGLEGNLMKEGIGFPQVKLARADDIVVSEEDFNVLLVIFLRDSDADSFGDELQFLWGNSGGWDFLVVGDGIDVGRVDFVGVAVFNIFQNPDKVISMQGNFIGGTVPDRNDGLPLLIGGGPIWTSGEVGLVSGSNVNKAFLLRSGPYSRVMMRLMMMKEVESSLSWVPQ
jgi:hypothetical protein